MIGINHTWTFTSGHKLQCNCKYQPEHTGFLAFYFRREARPRNNRKCACEWMTIHRVGNTRLLDLQGTLRRTGGHGKSVRQLQTVTA